MQVVLVDDKKWGSVERDLLYQACLCLAGQASTAATTIQFKNMYLKNLCTLQGLEKYGVGKWREISEELLPKWDDQAIRIKASRLMGSQSLARYVGWKGNR